MLISVLFGWAISGIMTYAGVFTDDKNDPGYKARTDAKSGGIAESDWFYLPYPGIRVFGVSYNNLTTR